MKKLLTPKGIDGAGCDGKPCNDIFDTFTPGLCLRVTAAKKSWCFVFTPPGGTSRTRMGFGTFPATDLKAARAKAGELRGLLEAGRDPRDAVTAPADKTIAELIDDRIRLEVRAAAENFLWSCLEIERCYDHDVIPIVGNVLVKDFRISHLNRVIDPIIARGAPTQANRVFQHMTSLTAFAVRRGEIDLDPLSAAEPPANERVKERVLTIDEVRHLWRGADKAMIRSKLVPDILRLILATGQRPGEECGGIERHEVDIQARLWTIPAHKTKNKHEHVVPLNDLALAILAHRMRLTNGSFLFPNNEGDGPLPNYTIAGCLARALEPEPKDGLPLGRLGIAKFTPHDLRRTFTTLASENLKLNSGEPMPEYYISHVLNHRSVTQKTVTARIYNKNQYLAEKREALDKWGAFLAQLVGVETGLRVAA